MTDKEFPYKKIFFIGGSSFSVRPIEVKVHVNLNIFGFTLTGKAVETDIVTEPTHYAFIDEKFERGRFCDGKVIPEYFQDYMPGLIYNSEYNLAVAGAATDFNFIDHYAKTQIPIKLGAKKLFIDSFKVEKSTSIKDQFLKISELEGKNKDIHKKNDDTLVIIQAGNNDLISLTYMSGLQEKWTNLSQDVYINNLDHIQKTFTCLADDSAQKLTHYILDTYENTSVKNYVVFGCMRVHECPMFMSVKNNIKIGDKNNNGIDDLTDFIDNMYLTYNKNLEFYINDVKSLYPNVNITFIPTPNHIVEKEQMTLSFLDEKGLRNGVAFEKATEQDKADLKNYVFFEPTHMTTASYKKIAEIYARAISMSDPKLSIYNK